MEKILFPMKYMRLTTGVNMLSHLGSNAIDIAGKDTSKENAFAPFTGTIKKVYKNGNTVWIQSNSPVQYADGTVDFATASFTHDNDVSNLWVGKVINQGEVFYQEGTANAVGAHIHLEIGRGKFTGAGWYQNKYGNWVISNSYEPWKAFWLKTDTIVLNSMNYPWKWDKEDIVKPTENQVKDTFTKYTGKNPVDQNQVNYYTQRDIRELYKDILGTTSPNKSEVESAFKTYLPDVKDLNAVPYYTNNPKSLLYKNIAGNLKNQLDKKHGGDFEEVKEKLYRKK